MSNVRETDSLVQRSGMSAANDSGDRLNQFKNKGKDANVSSVSSSHHSNTSSYIYHAVFIFLWVSTSSGAKAQESGSQRGASESKEG